MFRLAACALGNGQSMRTSNRPRSSVPIPTPAGSVLGKVVRAIPSLLGTKIRTWKFKHRVARGMASTSCDVEQAAGAATDRQMSVRPKLGRPVDRPPHPLARQTEPHRVPQAAAAPVDLCHLRTGNIVCAGQDTDAYRCTRWPAGTGKITRAPDHARPIFSSRRPSHFCHVNAVHWLCVPEQARPPCDIPEMAPARMNRRCRSIGRLKEIAPMRFTAVRQFITGDKIEQAPAGAARYRSA